MLCDCYDIYGVCCLVVSYLHFLLSSVFHDIYGFWCSVTTSLRLWHFHIIYVSWYNIYGFWCSAVLNLHIIYAVWYCNICGLWCSSVTYLASHFVQYLCCVLSCYLWCVLCSCVTSLVSRRDDPSPLRSSCQLLPGLNPSSNSLTILTVLAFMMYAVTL